MSARAPRKTVTVVGPSNTDVAVLKLLIIGEYDPTVHVAFAPRSSQQQLMLRTEFGVLRGHHTLAKYFANRVPRSTGLCLLGRDAWESAKVDEWMECVAAPLEGLANKLMQCVIRSDTGKGNGGLTSTSVELSKLLQLLDHHLQHNTFVVGSSTTLADVAIVASLARVFMFLADEAWQTKFRNVTRYFVSIAATDPFVAVLGVPSLCKRSVFDALASRADHRRANIKVVLLDDGNGNAADGEFVDEAAGDGGGGGVKGASPTDDAGRQSQLQEEEGQEEAGPLKLEQVALPADKPLIVPALNTKAGLDALESHFSRRHYVFNGRLTKADVSLRDTVQVGR